MLLFICGDIEVNPGPRKQLIISHSNVRSLYVNNSDIRISELHLMAKNNSIDILSLTETWLDHSVADCLISIPGYQRPFRRDRQGRRGGKWNESGFRPPLCTYRLNWARRTSWGWWDDWDDTVLQTQDSKFEPWRSEAEHATSRSRRFPTILTFTRGRGRNNFVSFKPPRPGTEPRTLAWKAAVLTTTLGPPPRRGGGVAIYCADHISARRRHDLEDDYNECVWIECFLDNIKVLFGTYYRPPGQSADERNLFLSHFESFVDLANDASVDSILITGDFNDKCTLWDDNHYASELKRRWAGALG